MENTVLVGSSLSWASLRSNDVKLIETLNIQWTHQKDIFPSRLILSGEFPQKDQTVIQATPTPTHLYMPSSRALAALARAGRPHGDHSLTAPLEGAHGRGPAVVPNVNLGRRVDLGDLPSRQRLGRCAPVDGEDDR